MGGAYGHMAHLYDNRALTFYKLKHILRLAARGELIGQEKLDGYNIYLNFRNGKAYYAKNKGEILSGGVDLATVATKPFKGKPEHTKAIRKLYTKVLHVFEAACRTLSQEEQKTIFGTNGEIFYNTEIITPEARNVLNYDGNIITIHHVGHMAVDPATKQIIYPDISTNVKMLDAVVDRMEEAASKQNFRIRRNAVIKLAALNNQNDLKIAIASIDQAMTAANVSDKETIQDFLHNKIILYVQDRLDGLNLEIHEIITNKILGTGNLKALSQGLSPEIKKQIASVVKEAEDTKLVNRMIYPLESAIHDFTVAMLRGLESAYILDRKKESMRVRKEVEHAIRSIQAYSGPGKEKATELLIQQLQKIKNVENIDTVVEGFVFDYNGVTYKFTGNFAPINQILGLFRFGRRHNKSPVPVLQEVTDVLPEASSEETIAVFPGAFKPPHKGHLASVEYLAKKANEVVILVSPLPRGNITFDVARQLWEIYLKASGLHNVKLHESTVNSPVAAAISFLEERGKVLVSKGQPNMTAYIAVSTKDGKRFGAGWKGLQKDYIPGITLKVMRTPAVESISATDMREAIQKGDKKTFKTFLPDVVQDQADHIWKIIQKSILKEDLYDTMQAMDVQNELNEERLGKLIESVQAALTERHHTPVQLVWHGTSSKFLKSILHTGLNPFPKQKVWAEDPAAEQDLSMHSRKSVGGTYLARNFGTASGAAQQAISKFGGEAIVILAQIQPRSAFADEDDIVNIVFRALESVQHIYLGSGGHDIAKLFGYYLFSDDETKKQIITQFSEEINKRVQFALEFNIPRTPEYSNAFEKVKYQQPLRDISTLTQLLEAILKIDCIKQHRLLGQSENARIWGLFSRDLASGAYEALRSDVQNEAESEGWDRDDWHKWELKTDATIRGTVKELDCGTYKEEENRFISALGALTRHYKIFAYNEIDWGWGTLRIEAPIGFSGANKIICVATVKKIDEPGSYRSRIIMHYGYLPSEAMQQIKDHYGLNTEFTSQQLAEHIRKRGNRWCVVHHDGKIIKCHSSKQKALRQHQAIMLSKKKQEQNEEEEELTEAVTKMLFSCMKTI
jgi:hypothetical protein